MDFLRKIVVGSWVVTYNPKPIPNRGYDWDAVEDNYDGLDSDLCFTAASAEECIKEIIVRADRHVSKFIGAAFASMEGDL